jgi:hypothetical protein
VNEGEASLTRTLILTGWENSEEESEPGGLEVAMVGQGLKTMLDAGCEMKLI